MQATKKNPLTAHLLDAGFAAGSDARIARHTGGLKEKSIVRRAMREPVSEVEHVELPAEFVAAGVAKLELLLKIGQFDAMKDAVDRLKLEYDLRQDSGGKPRSFAELLGCHVTELGLSVRTTNLLETAGTYTIGMLLEGFPAKFMDLPNCGQATIRDIARSLVQIGAMTTEDAVARVRQWEYEQQ